ncbi:hypothetical protein Ddc_14888 [Ditylenchus destructor]|nr:hypothetical protein Ddc_14888 [Ditylenchus destructor]
MERFHHIVTKCLVKPLGLHAKSIAPALTAREFKRYYTLRWHNSIDTEVVFVICREDWKNRAKEIAERQISRGGSHKQIAEAITDDLKRDDKEGIYFTVVYYGSNGAWFRRLLRSRVLFDHHKGKMYVIYRIKQCSSDWRKTRENYESVLDNFQAIVSINAITTAIESITQSKPSGSGGGPRIAELAKSHLNPPPGMILVLPHSSKTKAAYSGSNLKCVKMWRMIKYNGLEYIITVGIK